MSGLVTDIQEIMNKINGWEALDLDSEHTKEVRSLQQKQIMEQASLFHRVFKQNEGGQQVLDLLIAWTLVRPVSPLGQEKGYAFFREGQNDIVRSILMAIKTAEGE